jgi:hypothetical protein
LKLTFESHWSRSKAAGTHELGSDGLWRSHSGQEAMREARAGETTYVFHAPLPKPTKNQAGKTSFLVEHDLDYCWVHLGRSATVWRRWVFRAGVGREAVS